MPGTLFVVATPIGNLEDVTARALRILREASIVAAEDTRRTAHLLARYAITTPTTSLHEHNEVRKSGALIERLRGGENVALVSDAGTPTVSDPGNRLIAAAIEAGIRVEPVPGPSAALAALAGSGIQAETFVFLGFPPNRSSARNGWFRDLRSAGRPVVFFEAPHKIRETLERLRAEVGDLTISVGRELTKIHEEFVRGPISVVLRQLLAPKGEFTVVVDIGRMADIGAARAGTALDLAAELCHMTNNGSLTRRKAVGILAKRYGKTPNAVYAELERSKKSTT